MGEKRAAAYVVVGRGLTVTVPIPAGMGETVDNPLLIIDIPGDPEPTPGWTWIRNTFAPPSGRWVANENLPSWFRMPKGA